MRGIDHLLAEHPFFAGLTPAAVTLISGCATNRHVRAGEFLYREGRDAETFYVVRHGRVAVEVATPTGGALMIDTAEDGDVLGWSWLIPPHRWQFDARAVTDTRVVEIAAGCLRDKCDHDPAFGYAVMQRVAQVMYERLRTTRVQLLDLYGVSHALRG